MSITNPTIELAKELIAKPSVTPDDAGCQTLIASRLEAIGFNNEHLRFDDVDNLWSRRGNESPLFVFAGHTDVVPTGPLEKWSSDPFTPTIRDDHLYGRGAADMKSSLAAMVTATERFISQHPDHQGSIAFLITSDEEGPSINGTVKIIEHLNARNEKIDWCLVGEPTSKDRLGDIIKNGRRGSLCGTLIVRGIQGHIAYPHLADNPIHRITPALTELCATNWDDGNEFFPPTSFQISNIHSGTGADNVIPGDVEVLFNFRFSSKTTSEQLQQQIESVLSKHSVDYELTWRLSGQPFLTTPDVLVEATKNAVRDITQYEPQLSTDGGTSDGRFIAPTGAQVLELGPINATIHKIDECVIIKDLETLSFIYERMLELLLIDKA